MNLLQSIFIYLALSNNNNDVSACGKTFDIIFQTISSSSTNNVNVSDDIFLNDNASENCLWSLWSSWSVADCSDPSKNCNFAQFRTRAVLKNLQEESFARSSKGKEKQICQGQDKSYKNVCCISDSSRSQSFTTLIKAELHQDIKQSLFILKLALGTFPGKNSAPF